ncbi:DNA-binding protein [Pseudomonas sp. JDS28PS106]|uniref:DNA-binding protein n=1 Tax=Pseudomonas sp. JDS28PS106 TaxID=2497235 RepID=UPI002FCF3A67
MARGGVNKAVVLKARQALLAKGINPSIDAVRVELGNTGSKTTILRYLKEIESHDPRPTSSRERISDELNALVESLAERLMEEGSEAVAEAKAEFEGQRTKLESEVAGLQTELAAAQRQIATQHSALESQTAELATTHSSLQTELTRNAGIGQQCVDLELRVREKDAQIQSLEEKHVHARAALEHYRDAVREQREQDQRRHDSQLQQVQVELRKLQETLVVKQDESTRLNRDNERLLSEARQQSRLALERADTIERLTGEIKLHEIAMAKAHGSRELLQTQSEELRQQLRILEQRLTACSVRTADAEEKLGVLEAENETLRQQLSDFSEQEQPGG